MKNTSLLTLALLAAIAHAPATQGQNSGDTGSSKPIFVELSQQNGSGKAGWAVIESQGTNKTLVTVSVQNSGPSTNPVNIYAGVCQDMGGAVYKLNNVTNRPTSTDLGVSFAKFHSTPRDYKPLAISVGWDMKQPDKSLSCGEFTGSN